MSLIISVSVFIHLFTTSSALFFLLLKTSQIKRMQTSLQCYIKYTPVKKQLLCKTECDTLLVLFEKQSIKTVRGQYHSKTGKVVECSNNTCLKDSTGKKASSVTGDSIIKRLSGSKAKRRGEFKFTFLTQT